VGSPVTAGTINYEGAIDVTATATGADSVLAGIGRLVVEAQSREAPVARLADKIAGRSVPFPVTKKSIVTENICSLNIFMLFWSI
jgi:cation transport ATPase